MYSKIGKIGAVVLAVFLIGSMIALPMGGAISVNKESKNNISIKDGKVVDDVNPTEPDTQNVDEMARLDEYRRVEESTLASDQNDMGFNVDAGNQINRAYYFYPNEIVDESPGRTRIGYLDPNGGDDDDYYRFPVQAGQTITGSFSGSAGFDFELLDTSVTVLPNGYTAPETDWYFAHAYGTSGGKSQYSLDVTIGGQDDAGTGNDAGDSISSATSITPGNYEGYLDKDDWEDWYSFSANSGQGIFITVEEFNLRYGDFDIHLYNPSGKLVHSAMYYGQDELEYPADASGTWKFKIDMFPGWDTSKWPDDYYLYGSGPYELTLSVGGSAQSPPGPIPQTKIYPVAQTTKITNNPNSNDDEYAFLAAVPSAVYKQGGKQYVSPIVYSGDNYKTHWYGDADDTTQYLLDDWDAYLARHGGQATVYEVDSSDPIAAAASLATTRWAKSDEAVLAVYGGSFDDTDVTAIDEDATLNVMGQTTSLTPGDDRFSDFAGFPSYQMWLGKEWGAMTLYAKGPDCPAIGLTTTRYEDGTYEDWPHPYDVAGDNTNIYFPVPIPGLYWPYVDGNDGFTSFDVTTYTCDRYTLKVTDTDSSIEIDVDTGSNEYLEVFLVDPQGSVRRPSVPHWNGGDIEPLYIWNGDHHNGFEDYRRWEPTPGDKTIELHYPTTGKWTIVVTPHYPYGQEKSSDSIDYHITATIREHNAARKSAGLSASNGAVIASQQHIPLLYVDEDSVPAETQAALDQLGVSRVTFVNFDGVSSAKPAGTVAEITTMAQAIAKTKALTVGAKPLTNQDENVITITSFGSEDGFFAPAGLIAAYHGSNVIDIGEAAEAYNFLDKATTWREYAGGWYHGCRGQGHLAKASQPLSLLQIIRDFLQDRTLPPLGLDQHLRWWTEVHDGIYNWVDGLGLTGSGQEVYIFVAPRDTDIRHPVIRVMSGLGSYAGQFPFETPGLDAALMSRDILYPAIIYANPGRDTTTAQLMNYPDGWQWKTNDGTNNYVYSTREVKEAFSSHGRTFKGHVIWDNWLDEVNNGVSLSYYSGHGTGGSGVSAQFKNVADQFPDAELKHESLHDFEWWDAWRGYMYDDTATGSARDGGFTWYNAKEPNLYCIVHFKWVDQLLQNLHSEIELWMSCTTGQHFGPEIYLEHGSALWYGNAGTGLCPQEDLLDDQWIGEMMIEGTCVGEAFSKYVWLHQRDFTAENVDSSKYQQSLYGTSSMDVTNVQVLFGDPTLTCYSPEWTEPIPQF